LVWLAFALIPSWFIVASSRLLSHSFRRDIAAAVQELWAEDDRLYKRLKAILVFRQPRPHDVDGRFVRQRQTSAQGIGEELPAQIVDKLVAPLFVEIPAQTFNACSFTSVKRRHRFDR